MARPRGGVDLRPGVDPPGIEAPGGLRRSRSSLCSSSLSTLTDLHPGGPAASPRAAANVGSIEATQALDEIDNAYDDDDVNDDDSGSFFELDLCLHEDLSLPSPVDDDPPATFSDSPPMRAPAACGPAPIRPYPRQKQQPHSTSPARADQSPAVSQPLPFHALQSAVPALRQREDHCSASPESTDHASIDRREQHWPHYDAVPVTAPPAGKPSVGSHPVPASNLQDSPRVPQEQPVRMETSPGRDNVVADVPQPVPVNDDDRPPSSGLLGRPDQALCAASSPGPIASSVRVDTDDVDLLQCSRRSLASSSCEAQVSSQDGQGLAPSWADHIVVMGTPQPHDVDQTNPVFEVPRDVNDDLVVLATPPTQIIQASMLKPQERQRTRRKRSMPRSRRSSSVASKDAEDARVSNRKRVKFAPVVTHASNDPDDDDDDDDDQRTGNVKDDLSGLLYGFTFLTTGFSRTCHQEQRQALLDAIAALGGVVGRNDSIHEFVNDGDDRDQHIRIVLTNGVPGPTWTAKVVYTLLRGVPPVNATWVSACRQERRILPLAPFSSSDINSVPGLSQTHVPPRIRIERVLSNLRIAYFGPNKQDFLGVILAGGARIARQQKLADVIILNEDDEASAKAKERIKTARKQGIPVVTLQWLKDCARFQRAVKVADSPYRLDRA
ncbi:Uncharacterized protein PBTT_06331 [Plasmodiophora brassicae]